MANSWFKRVTVAGSLIAGGLVLAATSPASALTCTSGVEGDVNGDGYAEVAASAENASDPGGGVHVFYGRAKGLSGGPSGSALNDQYIDQSVSGVIGDGNEWDHFGESLAFGDFNDDGCADLAVGAGGDAPEEVGEAPEEYMPGSIYVFYGSKSGLKMTGSKRITSEEVFGLRTEGFGEVLAAGDLNHDGVTDLASGRTVVILEGSSGGLSADQSTEPELDGDAGSFGGGALAVGDFDGDETQELAIGRDGGSQVQILEWNGSSYAPTTAEPLTGPSLGVDDVMKQESEEEPGEMIDVHTFGRVLAAGDVDADGDDDLAVGMPEVGLGGSVALVKGSASGLTAAGVNQWNQASPGVVGANGVRHFFGDSLAMGRLDSGPTDDLAIGSIFDDVDGKNAAGSVTILLGSPAGLTTAGNGGTRFHQNTSGIAGSVESGDYFGSDVAISHVQSKTLGSLIIGAPGEDVGKVTEAGQFHQLSIASSGPKTSGSVALNLGSTGVKGAVRGGGYLGYVLD